MKARDCGEKIMKGFKGRWEEVDEKENLKRWEDEMGRRSFF